MTTLAGSTSGFADGSALSAQFDIPYGVATDTVGNIFVSEYNGARIRRIDWVTRIVSTVAGNGVLAERDGAGTYAEFRNPYALTMFNGAIWVADMIGGTVRYISMVKQCGFLRWYSALH